LKQKTTYSEAELLEGLNRQDAQAFSYLYDNYAAALLGIISQIVPDRETANDTLQQVFINIWKKIGSYDPGKGRLFTWMLNIARNASIDHIRSRSYKDSLKNQTLPENVYSVSGQVTTPEYDNIGLRKIVSRLRDDQQILVELSYFQGYTHEEISKALDIPLGTVKTRIRSALIQLRKMIGEK
jgi:RNA polymerase sigma factor (sigma-70 family)